MASRKRASGTLTAVDRLKLQRANGADRSSTPIPRTASPFDGSKQYGVHAARAYLLDLIERETPWLHAHQQRWRKPWLDEFMTHVSLLGTHTFFLSFLPTLFWFPQSSTDARLQLLAQSLQAYGRTMVVLLCLGVYVTGFIKDLLALPRPGKSVEKLSLTRSVTLEYGFPSTHSANAVSIALATMYFAWYSWLPLGFLSVSGAYILSGIVLLQAVLVCYSRIYCGMHSITDVVGGVLTGVVLNVWWCGHAQLWYESFLLAAVPLIAFPDPMHPCPCFEDAVCFVGVVIGITYSGWTTQHVLPLNVLYPVNQVTGDAISITVLQLVWTLFLRIIVGLLAIFMTRFTLKKLMFAVLPPIFGYCGLSTSTKGLIHHDMATFHREPPHKHVSDNGVVTMCSKYHIPRLTIDNITKLVVYCSISLCAAWILPEVVFPHLGI